MDCADCHVSENLICHKDEYALAKRRELNLTIIIIIIKKVKIIVTLSIKNTAGALYKSQIKGENR